MFLSLCFALFNFFKYLILSFLKIVVMKIRLMKIFGKQENLEGDIMNVEFRGNIKETTVIFINNLLFDVLFMLRLKRAILQHLDEGVKIITKLLGDPKKINAR
ncbi:hypothetical protein B9Z55_025389 [Caenorhabditis nigoni]|uniref:DOT1 domain-containing protein n=1 Tax=Caenorhabditis nigoni TaxID=1611254 RepID=A0A2G5SYZ5_9PELO|nr:hypothetical protein B9Z55_025389 [Caenorhabditis nigoni]